MKKSPQVCPYCGQETVCKGKRHYEATGLIERWHCTRVGGCNKYHERNPETGELIDRPNRRESPTLGVPRGETATPRAPRGSAVELIAARYGIDPQAAIEAAGPEIRIRPVTAAQAVGMSPEDYQTAAKLADVAAVIAAVVRVIKTRAATEVKA